ncbi:response regulator [Flavobacterium sp. 3HN19-14]|uniref:response regulator n=1 Tax=Flavobacterium sp. 3HN19-14 TaxID=3448133 RepID=UPI003EDF344E
MNGNFKRNLVVSSVISMLILLVSSTASYVAIANLLQSYRMVNHTQEVIYNLNEAKFIALDAQNSVRGYLITGKSNLLTPYFNAEVKSKTYFDNLLELTVDNPRQQKNIAELAPKRDAFYAYLKERVDYKSAGNTATEAHLSHGKELLDDLRESYKKIGDEEQRLLAIRTGDTDKYGGYSLILIVVAALLALAISIIFFSRMLKDFTQRQRLQAELQKNEIETAERIRVISGIAGQISQGNYEIRVNDTESDALGSVGDSLNNMAQSLDHSFTLLAEKEWLQAGIAQINDVMLGEKTLEQLAKDVVASLSAYTGSSAGVLYAKEADYVYAVSGYSYIPSKDRENFKVGEGLIGEVAATGKIMELRDLTPESIRISYALGEVKPAHVIAIPLTDNNAVEGVVELANIKEYTQLQIDFLRTISGNIGIAMTAAQNRKRLQELLEETQSQSEELRLQHTELESMNAELETQTEKLQASEEELKVQQEELQQTNEELAERSVLLEEQNTEIQKKSEALELSTRYKSEFLANMSHELRTPLNSILLLSRLLSENNDKNMNDEQIEFARVIQSSGNGLLGLIDEILDLSKIEAGKMELEFLDTPLKEITDSLKSLFTEVAKAKNIEFKIEDTDAPLVLKTDKMRLEQILKNLISNALKFTSKGGVTLAIYKDPKNERTICFSVKDTGIGIPTEKQPLIFEAFQQADGSTKRKYGGTGLGLSISRELAKLLKGEISLKSKIDEGSEFTLCLPVSGSAAMQTTNNKTVLDVSEEEPASVPEINTQYISAVIPEDVPDDRNQIAEADKVILIVEDDVNFAKSLLEFTRQRGYKGVVSVRGDFAINFALTYKPVGILLDIQLPIKSGWEVMEELKNNALTKHIPVHIMSSHQLKQESLLKGAVNFLDKPVAYEQMPEIFKKIERIVNRESQKVLIIEDNPKHAKALAYFLEGYNINSEIKSEVTEGVDALQNSAVDCVILDMGIPDKQAYEILENVKKNAGMENLPVIVFTGKSLSMQEELRIKKYADSIVVKTAHSYQRMLDEVSLFLHLVEETKNGNGKTESRKNHYLNNVLKHKTVLIVDDDVRNIYSLTKALEVLKMNVITAIDGKEALNALEQHPKTDVVLLDMMMPNMDGYETATRIRQKKEFKTLPVIAVTAKAMTGDREKCINAGASDYITKPVDVDQLLSLLRVWLYDRK